MSHPVRPASFMEISNFYTLTIYEKGAEVVRMIHTLLGAESFRKGSDLYFDRHDGEAATIENFVSAMEDASGRNLDQFTRWYSQAGTPRVATKGQYREDLQQYHLTLTQSCPDTPEAKGEDKSPFVIPVAMGLLGEAGNIALHLEGEPVDCETSDNTHRVLELNQTSQTFVFQQVFEAPIPVLLREFSAPVKLEYTYERDELKAIMSRDSDGFSRWDASQKLALLALNDIIAAYRNGQEYLIEPLLIDAYRSVLVDESLDQAMVALMVQLPSEAYLSELSDEVDVEAIHFAREHLKSELALSLRAELESAYHRSEGHEPFSVDSTAIAKRSLKNTVLGYLSTLPDGSGLTLAQQQLSSARNMTDELAGLSAINHSAAACTAGVRDRALSDFYQRWKHEALVVNQWLQVQASCHLGGGLERVKALMEHDAFDIKNPNKIRSLIGVFASSNTTGFHVADGSGYEFLADQILVLDTLNPQVASRMLSSLTKWRKYGAQRQEKMRTQLARILAKPDLSKDVYEVVSKSLS